MTVVGGEDTGAASTPLGSGDGAAVVLIVDGRRERCSVSLSLTVHLFFFENKGTPPTPRLS